MAQPDPKSYDTLLRVRQRQEDLRAQTLAEARRREHLALAERDALAQEQQRMLEEAGTLLTRHFDAADVRRYFQHERHLARLGDDKDIQILEFQAQAEARRLALKHEQSAAQASKELEISDRRWRLEQERRHRRRPSPRLDHWRSRRPD